MALSFNIPKSPKKQVYEADKFLGADFTSEASTVEENKSPNCVNMIRSVPGKIRKRMGYEEAYTYDGQIYGVHYYSVRDTWYVHSGTKLYDLTAIRGAKWVSAGEITTEVPRSLTSQFPVDNLSQNIHDYVESLLPPAPPNPIFTYSTKYYNYTVLFYEYDAATGVPVSAVVRVNITYLYVASGVANDYVVDSASHDNIMFLTDNFADTEVYSGMAEHRSVAFELNGYLIILDGTSVKVVSADGIVRLLTDIAYIPTLTLAKDYTGGGKDYEPLNLVQPGFIEQFYVKTNSSEPGYDPSLIKTFQLSFGGLDATTVKAWVLNQNGEWIEKTENTDFTVDRQAGSVTFTTAPGASPLEGEDNVKIQAYRTVEGYADRINHCTIGAMFGVNGAHDRIFLSGNPDSGVSGDITYTLRNCDWFSEQYDPTYFADTWYSKLGADNSAIMGYSIINNYLAAHKDQNELTQSILIREGDLVDDEPVFKLINTLQGAGAISKYCFSYLETEPVFLTNLGVYAVTAQDITGEKYAQDRSYYLEGKLLKEKNLKDAHGFSWKDFYIVSVNEHLYVLDGLQPMHTDRAKPYATRQYAGFYFDNIPATCFFEKDDCLYFGSYDGKIYRFFSDDKDINSYNDNGQAIRACWETADISDKLFYKKKTYRYIAVRCLPEIRSSLVVSVQKNGIWNELNDDQVNLKYFSYANMRYSKMTYSTNKTQKISATKIRVKKLDHVRFKFENNVLNEPLGINDFAVEYTQAGNVK